MKKADKLHEDKLPGSKSCVATKNLPRSGAKRRSMPIETLGILGFTP